MLSGAPVVNTDAIGAAERCVCPRPPGSGVVNLDSMSELTIPMAGLRRIRSGGFRIQMLSKICTISHGFGFGTWASTESKQFETVSLAAVSTVYTATSTDPIPRYQALAPATDCNLLNDCGAAYFPKTVRRYNSAAIHGPGRREYQVAYTAWNKSRRREHALEHQHSATQMARAGCAWTLPAASNNATIPWMPCRKPDRWNLQTQRLLMDAGPDRGSRVVPITLTVTARLPCSIGLR